MNTQGDSTTDVITLDNVLEALHSIQSILQDSKISESANKKMTTYLDAAKTASVEDEPDKELIFSTLKTVSKNVKDVDQTLDSGEKIFHKISPFLTTISSWLGSIDLGFLSTI